MIYPFAQTFFHQNIWNVPWFFLWSTQKLFLWDIPFLGPHNCVRSRISFWLMGREIWGGAESPQNWGLVFLDIKKCPLLHILKPHWLCYKEVGLGVRSSLFAGLAELYSLPRFWVIYLLLFLKNAPSLFSNIPLLSALIIQGNWQNLINDFYMKIASLTFLCLLGLLNIVWAK